MKKIQTVERVGNMTQNFKNITLAAHDLRWQCLQENDLDSLESMEFLCNNLEECVRKITELQSQLESRSGFKKKNTLSKIIFG